MNNSATCLELPPKMSQNEYRDIVRATDGCMPLVAHPTRARLVQQWFEDREYFLGDEVLQSNHFLAYLSQQPQQPMCETVDLQPRPVGQVPQRYLKAGAPPKRGRPNCSTIRP